MNSLDEKLEQHQAASIAKKALTAENDDVLYKALIQRANEHVHLASMEELNKRLAKCDGRTESARNGKMIKVVAKDLEMFMKIHQLVPPAAPRGGSLAIVKGSEGNPL